MYCIEVCTYLVFSSAYSLADLSSSAQGPAAAGLVPPVAS